MLASVLLTRLSHWQTDARQLRLETALAAVQRAIPVFQAHCMREPDPRCERLLIDRQLIAGAHGHAAARPDGIARLAGLSADTGLRQGLRDGVATLSVSVARAGAPRCEFTYVEAAHAGAAPDIDPASISCP